MSLILTRRVGEGVRLYNKVGIYLGRVSIADVEWERGHSPRVKISFEAEVEHLTVLRDELGTADMAKALTRD